MVLYKEAMSELKATDKRRERADEQARRDKAAAQRHRPDDDIPTALHASTPSEPATRDTLDCTGQPRMYEGVFIRMSQPTSKPKSAVLTTAQIAVLLDKSDARLVRLWVLQGRWGTPEKDGLDTGKYLIEARVFWAWAQQLSSARQVRIQARWPHSVLEPWK